MLCTQNHALTLVVEYSPMGLLEIRLIYVNHNSGSFLPCDMVSQFITNFTTCILKFMLQQSLSCLEITLGIPHIPVCRFQEVDAAACCPCCWWQPASDDPLQLSLVSKYGHQLPCGAAGRRCRSLAQGSGLLSEYALTCRTLHAM